MSHPKAPKNDKTSLEITHKSVNTIFESETVIRPTLDETTVTDVAYVEQPAEKNGPKVAFTSSVAPVQEEIQIDLAPAAIYAPALGFLKRVLANPQQLKIVLIILALGISVVILSYRNPSAPDVALPRAKEQAEAKVDVSQARAQKRDAARSTSRINTRREFMSTFAADAATAKKLAQGH